MYYVQKDNRYPFDLTEKASGEEIGNCWSTQEGIL